MNITPVQQPKYKASFGNGSSNAYDLGNLLKRVAPELVDEYNAFNKTRETAFAKADEIASQIRSLNQERNDILSLAAEGRINHISAENRIKEIDKQVDKLSIDHDEAIYNNYGPKNDYKSNLSQKF